MAEGWRPPDIGQHAQGESCNNCWRRPELGDGLTRADYWLMPPRFCPYVTPKEPANG
jgi:hypothetical protein